MFLPQKENERWCFLLFYTMTPRGMCCFFPGLATFCSNFLTELAFGGKNIPCFPRVNGACAPTWNPSPWSGHRVEDWVYQFEFLKVDSPSKCPKRLEVCLFVEK